MTGMSDFTEDELIKAFFRNGDLTTVPVMAVALLTTPAIDSDSGVFTAGTGVEVIGGGYQRVDHPPLDSNWSASAGGDGTTFNLGLITFPKATANWGLPNVVAFALVDNIGIDLGNMYYHGMLGTPKPIDTDDTAEFPVGGMVVTFD